MTEAEVFVLADRALNNVVAQIKDDQWAMPIPAWFQLGRTQGDETLRTIINYHAYDELWVPETLAGKAVDDPDMPAMGDDLLGDEPKAKFAELTDKAVAAVQAVSDVDKPVHLSYGDWPVRDYLMHITSFRGFRAFDLARLIGVDANLPEDLVQGMWELFSPHFDEWRQMGVFGPAVAVDEDAPLQDKLIAGSGRNPREGL
jgi:uncharacterized protein (TIGR03086 family)